MVFHSASRAVAVRLNAVPTVSVPECWVVKVKLARAPGVAVMLLLVPDWESAVAWMVVESLVKTSLNPLMAAVAPEVNVWLPLAGLEALLPFGEEPPPVAKTQVTEWAPV